MKVPCHLVSDRVIPCNETLGIYLGLGSGLGEKSLGVAPPTHIERRTLLVELLLGDLRFKI